jgi:hypothetical protein
VRVDQGLSNVANVAGILRQIEAVLVPQASLDTFIHHHEENPSLTTWEFACRYRLESVVKGVEEHIQDHPFKNKWYIEDTIRCATGLPSSSTDLAMCSMARMLHTSNKKWAKLQTLNYCKGQRMMTAILSIEQELGGLTRKARRLLEKAKEAAAGLG